MPLSDRDLADLYDEGDGLATPGACPDADVLIRAALGDLPEAERLALAGHVEQCRSCAEDFSIAATLMPPPQAAAIGGPVVTFPGAAAAPRPPRSWRTFVPHTIAATLAIGCVGLAAWAIGLRDENVRLETRLAQAARVAPAEPAPVPVIPPPPTVAERPARQPAPNVLPETGQPAAAVEPEMNVPIVDLDAAPLTRGETTAGRQLVEWPARTALVTLIFAAADAGRFDEYAVRIARVDGDRRTPVWSGGGLRRGDDESLTMAVPTRLLPAGQYDVALEGVTGSRRTTVQRYPLTVRYR